MNIVRKTFKMNIIEDFKSEIFEFKAIWVKIEVLFESKIRVFFLDFRNAKLCF